MNKQKNMEIILYGDDQRGNCTADIILPESGARVCGFKVMQMSDGGIAVYMPGAYKTTWPHGREISWYEVRMQVTEAYRNRPKSAKPTNVFRFYDRRVYTEVLAEVGFRGCAQGVSRIVVSRLKEAPYTIRVKMPADMRGQWSCVHMEWERLSGIVELEYRRQLLGEELPEPEGGVFVAFSAQREITSCRADVKLFYQQNGISGFTVRKVRGEDRLKIFTPKTIGQWRSGKVSWTELCEMITGEFHRYDAAAAGRELQPIPREEPAPETEHGPAPEEEAAQEASEAAPGGEAAPQRPQPERNEMGRIKNAENATLRFFPNTVLRETCYSSQGEAQRKLGLFSLINSINRAEPEDIRPFEINITAWVAKLRYVMKTTLMDLIEAGYIVTGREGTINSDKLTKAFKKMYKYQLVNLSKLTTIDDDGNPVAGSGSPMMILTLGSSGSRLLKELGRAPYNYNAFDIYQDGNTVRRYLIANQWLVYWLKTYRNEIGDNYEASRPIYHKGREYVGARIYATVTLRDQPMVVEPIRRSDACDRENTLRELEDKLSRMIGMFEDREHLYQGNAELHFPKRPVLTLMCEDDEHIREVRQAVGHVLDNSAEQIIWYTTDLRIFNEKYQGQRFLHMEGEELLPVRVAEFFGLEKEADDHLTQMEEDEEPAEVPSPSYTAESDDLSDEEQN